MADPDITRAEIEAFLTLTDVPLDACILDLCCGQGRHVLELSKRGYTNLHGVDRSHYLISRAKRTATAANHIINFREGDARKLRYPESMFDLTYLAGNSFGYFESADDDIEVLRELRRLLKPGSIVLLDITDGHHLRNHYEPRSWEWIDKNYFVCRERSLSSDNSRLISREVITHTKKGVVADQFYAERLYNKDQLADMLTENGLDFSTTQNLGTELKRNQDLGMMAHRFIVTATSNKLPTIPRFSKKSKIRKVTVLMGDHRRSDTVKPNSTFDEDDFHTIDELKKALANQTDYQISFLNDHDALLRSVGQLSSQADFVFNLTTVPLTFRTSPSVNRGWDISL